MGYFVLHCSWHPRRTPRTRRPPQRPRPRRRREAVARPRRRSGRKERSTYDKLYKEVPAYKLITPAVVSERLKIRGSLARKALNELQQKGLIKQVVKHSAQLIYTRTTKGDDAVAA